uniref:Zinc finger protein 26 n=1 Tax=Phallusia mammillata TaxID=59560 RepID=A0A6F9DXU7_9ASCI|nr:zinc finger protein 26 [Phallusia mammillata]
MNRSSLRGSFRRRSIRFARLSNCSRQNRHSRNREEEEEQINRVRNNTLQLSTEAKREINRLTVVQNAVPTFVWNSNHREFDLKFKPCSLEEEISLVEFTSYRDQYLAEGIRRRLQEIRCEIFQGLIASTDLEQTSFGNNPDEISKAVRLYQRVNREQLEWITLTHAAPARPLWSRPIGEESCVINLSIPLRHHTCRPTGSKEAGVSNWCPYPRGSNLPSSFPEQADVLVIYHAAESSWETEDEVPEHLEYLVQSIHIYAFASSDFITLA